MQLLDDADDLGGRWFRSPHFRGAPVYELFAIHASLCGCMPLDLSMKLVERDAGQESPQVARFVEVVFAALDMHEKASIRRLHNIFGIDAGLEFRRNPFTCEGDEPMDVPIEDGGRGLALAGPAKLK